MNNPRVLVRHRTNVRFGDPAKDAGKIMDHPPEGADIELTKPIIQEVQSLMADPRTGAPMVRTTGGDVWYVSRAEHRDYEYVTLM